MELFAFLEGRLSIGIYGLLDWDKIIVLYYINVNYCLYETIRYVVIICIEIIKCKKSFVISNYYID